MGNIVLRMHSRIRPEVVAVHGGRVGHARIAQHQRKDRGKGGPDDQNSGERAGPSAKSPLQQSSRDIEAGLGTGGLVEFPPGNHAENADVHHHIDRRHQQDGIDQGPGDGPLGLAHLRAEKADVVVAPVVVGGHQQPRAQAQREAARKLKGMRRKAEGAGGAEVAESGGDDQRHRGHHAHPKILRHASHDGDAPVEQHDRQHTASHGRKSVVRKRMVQRW